MSDEVAPKVRLAKLIASRGLASRREAERWIEDERVTVHGRLATVTTQVDPDGQDVRVDGKSLPPQPQLVYYVMYKPRGVITGRNDPNGRTSVLDMVYDLAVRVEPVGRLDVDTEGALLLTNDGDLAHRLTHPSMAIPKRYMAKVYRRPSDADLDSITKGKVFLDDGRVAPARVRVAEATDKDNCWVEITVTEGRNRLIRRLFERLRHPVSKLRRESFATISIRGMERGQLRRLSGPEVARLKDQARGVKPQRAGRKYKKKGFAIAKPKLGRPQGRKRRLTKSRQKKRA